jgi:hypothetical protein
MKLNVRGSFVSLGLLAAMALAGPVGARTIDVSSSDAGIFTEQGRYLIDGHLTSGQGAYADPARSRTHVRGALTELYRKGRRLALEELQVPQSTSLRADHFAVDLVKQDDFRAMLVLGAILVAQQLRRKHRSLKQSLISG